MPLEFNSMIHSTPTDIGFQDPWVAALYVGIVLSLLSVWVNRGASVFFAVISCCLGYYASQLTLEAFPFLAGIVLAGLLYLNFKSKWLKLPLAIGILSLAAVGGKHILPGFEPFVLIQSVQLSPDAYQMNLSYHFDRALFFLMAAWFLAYPIPHSYRQTSALKWGVSFTLLCSATVIPLALYFNFVRFDLKWPDFSLYWMAYNLLFVCVAEELFFRGLILRRLKEGFNSTFLGTVIALIISSVLFALYHYQGGPVYMGLAGVAGIFYGCAYLKTDKLSASIITHFLFNSIHFFAFSYPALR